ncbi:MAG: hypothetical protein JWO63_1216 [Frankiales bacterium]|nr:hypothetical protein [Frankiales bacterium]
MTSPNGWARKNQRTPAELARRAKYASAEHREQRKQRVAAATPSTPCSRCGRPLGPNRSRWHLPHDTTGTRYLPGLWCAPCNLSEAASRGARTRNAQAKARGQQPTARVTGLSW